MKRDTLPTLDEILEMIERRSRDVELVHIAVAAGSTVSWLKQVINRTTNDPSYARMKAVYEFLKRKERSIKYK